MGTSVISHLELNGLATRAEEQGTLSPSASQFTTLKVKVGGGASIAEEAARVQAIAEVAIRHGKKLRLDANQAWTLEEAVEFANKLGQEALAVVEYIEEPLADPNQLVEFGLKSGMKYALDESIDQGVWEGLLGEEYLAGLVLKPAIVGGFERCKMIQAKAGPNVQV